MLPSISERRKQIKQEKRAIERKLFRVKEQLSLLENQLYLDTPFKSVASDQKGRRAEYELVLANNKSRSVIREEVIDLEQQVEDLEDLLSSINFKHRERMIIQMSNLDEVTSRMVTAIEKFEAAVEKFALARSR